MSRAVSFAGKTVAKIIEGAVTGAIDGVLQLFGPQSFELMIQNDYYIIESILYAAKRRPDYSQVKGLTPEMARRVEARRAFMTKMALGILGMVKSFASRIPRPVLEQYLTPERFEKWMREKYPDLWKVVEKYGEKGKAWLRNEVEKDIKPFLLGAGKPSN